MQTAWPKLHRCRLPRPLPRACDTVEPSVTEVCPDWTKLLRRAKLLNWPNFKILRLTNLECASRTARLSWCLHLHLRRNLAAAFLAPKWLTTRSLPRKSSLENPAASAHSLCKTDQAPSKLPGFRPPQNHPAKKKVCKSPSSVKVCMASTWSYLSSWILRQTRK